MKPDDFDAKIKFFMAETLRGHFKHYTGRRVTRFYDSGAASALDMGMLVSKMEESIEAHCQASLKTTQDPDGGPFPAYPAGKSWDEVPGKTGSGKKFSAMSFREPISQPVDSDRVDPGWDGELIDNAFVFARTEHH